MAGLEMLSMESYFNYYRCSTSVTVLDLAVSLSWKIGVGICRSSAPWITPDRISAYLTEETRVFGLGIALDGSAIPRQGTSDLQIAIFDDLGYADSRAFSLESGLIVALNMQLAQRSSDSHR